jgi:hypothetical protein
MNIDLQAMAEIFGDAFVPFVVKHHGDAASPVVRSILSFIKGLWEYIAPESLNHQLVIFQTLNDADRPISSSGLECYAFTELANKVLGPCVIQVVPSGAFILWTEHSANALDLSQTAVVYSFEKGTERFYAKSESKLLRKLIPGRTSNFAVPTFNDLREALAAYRDTQVLTSSCDILSTAWYEPNRLFFKPAPEETIRRSLTRYLKITFEPNAEVRPEQIVDESHPVDIKVTWFMTNRLALIEIKWLGRSRDDAGIKNNHTVARAKSGAKQLADYMDANKVQATTHETRGYLVVVDARRAKLSINKTTLSTDDGMKFAASEIPYDPKFHEIREDFETPIRMFVRPVCNT